MQFKRALSLSTEERRQLLGWGWDIFNSESLHLIWRPKETQLVLYVDEQAVSTCGLLKQSVLAGEHEVKVGGIGGVVTPPVYQGRGYARQILKEATRIFAQEWSLDAGMLFCREALVPFYRKLGWQQLEAPVTILQPAGAIRCPTPVMIYPLSGPWPTGPVDTDSLPW